METMAGSASRSRMPQPSPSTSPNHDSPPGLSSGTPVSEVSKATSEVRLGA